MDTGRPRSATRHIGLFVMALASLGLLIGATGRGWEKTLGLVVIAAALVLGGISRGMQPTPTRTTAARRTIGVSLCAGAILVTFDVFEVHAGTELRG